jgi:hypothetical protein
MWETRSPSPLGGISVVFAPLVTAPEDRRDGRLLFTQDPFHSRHSVTQQNEEQHQHRWRLLQQCLESGSSVQWVRRPEGAEEQQESQLSPEMETNRGRALEDTAGRSWEYDKK